MASRFLDRQQLVVTGFPRSGNTWLSRLLGDALNSPVTGWKAAKPLAEEGLDRPGDYVVRQLHLQPMYDVGCNEFMPNAYRANIPAWNGEKVIHIMRDPRDVAVSLMHYWNRPSIEDAVEVMLDGKNPVKVHGRWLHFVSKWMAVNTIPVYHVTYERLNMNPAGTLKAIARRFELPLDDGAIMRAVDNQAFEKKRQHIAAHGDDYNYGEAIQLKAMRKGVVGDWVNHFSVDLAQSTWDVWGHFINEHISKEPE